MDFYDLVNFRNRHHTPNTWPELNFGGSGFKTDTYSRDWQFAPHPTMFVLRQNDLSMFFGALDLPMAFGMYMEVEDVLVNKWFLNYGPAGFGQQLACGEQFISPRFSMFIDEGASVHETVARYTRILIQEGLIPDPADKRRFVWHKEPVYCTWNDQISVAGTEVPADLKEQVGLEGALLEVMDDSLVRRALNVIRDENLPIGIIIIDEGWEVTRGQWEPHPRRFPDFRRLIDDIHAVGLKAVVWWNWAELYDDAEVDERHLFAGGKRNMVGLRLRDYSNPATREEYLKPLFHKLFSAEDGCYDLDGVKTDFLAEKVYPDFPLFDPTWRGEENYHLHITRCFYKLMKSIKPDAMHMGCAGHPYLADYIDINRTYDVWRNYVEHLTRAEMLVCTTPGCPVSTDLCNSNDMTEDCLRAARDRGYSVQLGQLLKMRTDHFAAVEDPTPDFYEMLRRGLRDLAYVQAASQMQGSS